MVAFTYDGVSLTFDGIASTFDDTVRLLSIVLSFSSSGTSLSPVRFCGPVLALSFLVFP